MYRRSAPTWVYAGVLAIVAGTLLGRGDYIVGGVLAVAAVVLLASWMFWDKDDTEGLY